MQEHSLINKNRFLIKLDEFFQIFNLFSHLKGQKVKSMPIIPMLAEIYINKANKY